MTTATEVIEEVRRLAAEQPDFVYGKQEGAGGGDCSYFGCTVGDSAGQACIVGQALANLNVDMSGLKREEDQGFGMGIVDALEHEVVDIPYTDREARWLGDVQHNQDFKKPWARAVELADQGLRPWN